MGIYIEIPVVSSKTKWLLDNQDGQLIDKPPATYQDIPEGKALIIVVSNGAVEAAAFIYDETEFKLKTERSDTRPKRYVLIDRDTAEFLTGY